jgi:hypothetical protein
MKRHILSRHNVLYAWFMRVHLSAWRAALAGGGAGLVVGLVIVRSMWRQQFFTQAHQNIIAGAILTVIWIAIGAVSGLTVLSPITDNAEPPA